MPEKDKDALIQQEPIFTEEEIASCVQEIDAWLPRRNNKLFASLEEMEGEKRTNTARQLRVAHQDLSASISLPICTQNPILTRRVQEQINSLEFA